MLHNFGFADTRRRIDNHTLRTVEQDIDKLIMKVIEMKLVFIDMLKTVP
jgi:hypothetical protein